MSMTRDRTRAVTDQPEIPTADDGPRMAMKPVGVVTRGHLDGGWWPRSMEPTEEFPGLIRALYGHVGEVSRVSYNLDFWEPVHRKVTVDGRVVRCEGFHTMNPHTVTVIGQDSLRVTVLVVPPHTSDEAARAALRAAADEDNTATVEEILAGEDAFRRPVR